MSVLILMCIDSSFCHGKIGSTFRVIALLADIHWKQENGERLQMIFEEPRCIGNGRYPRSESYHTAIKKLVVPSHFLRDGAFSSDPSTSMLVSSSESRNPFIILQT